MKKFVVSTSLAAISAASIQTGLSQNLELVLPKAWSISGTLRGFYDDNYNIAEANKGSWGGEIAPSVSYNLPLRQTDMGIRYNYALYYYNDRDNAGLDPFDHSHQVEVWLEHAFNTRWKLRLTDTFAIGQEPELLQPDPGSGSPTPYRISGNNIANHGNISLDTQWTRQFSTSVHYGNNFYDYEDKGTGVIPGGLLGGIGFPVSTPGGSGFQQLDGGASLSGLLDRVDHDVGIDFQWTFSPETMVFIGGSYSWTEYLGDEPISVFNYVDTAANPRNLVYYSRNRDSRSYSGHVGLSHQLTSNISVMLSAGASYTDSFNDPLAEPAHIAPTASASISYTYIPGSYVQLGVTHAQNATDVVAPGDEGSITQYQYTTVVYGDINHKFTEKLIGTLIGRFTYSTFQGGAARSEADYGFNLGLNLNYRINRHFSADAGYNFDTLLSGLVGRDYDRNRVYLGLSANY